MTPKNTKAAPGQGRRFGFEKAVAAFESENTTAPQPNQHSRAAERIARRFHLTMPVARLVADLVFGEAHA